ncbi:MAG TPA: hypothetical protein VF493_18205 [Terriglobales bacterium]
MREPARSISFWTRFLRDDSADSDSINWHTLLVKSSAVVCSPKRAKKCAEAQRGWRAAQQELNAMLGIERVFQLHLLVNKSIELLRNADGVCKDKKDADE